MAMPDFNCLTPAQIKSSLQSGKGAETFDKKPRWDDQHCHQAAVLIPFFFLHGEWRVLFIRRSTHDHDPHSGQVAFAGGKYEPGDNDLTATALREAQEEIGLPAHYVDVLGELPVHHSISRFRITPVVAVVSWPCPLTPDPREVSRIFSIPLNWLADDRHHRMQKHRQPNGETVIAAHFDEYDGELLWGATARMTLSLVARLKNLAPGQSG